MACAPPGDELVAVLTPLSRWLVEQTDTVVAVKSGALVTAHDFSSRVRQWMTSLERHSGHRWALYHSDSCEFLAILMALWQLQRSACIPSDNKPGTVARLATVVDGFIGEFPSAVEVLARPDSEPISSRQWVVADADFIGLEIYTSGSSGDPKLVSKTIVQLEREIEILESLWPTESGSVVLSTVSHQHFYGMTFSLFKPFSSTARIECQRCEFPEDVISRAAHYPRIILVSSPSHLTRFNSVLDWNPVASRCIYAISSTAPLAREDSLLVGKLLEAPVREIYGSTETGAIAWRSQQESRSDAKWRPIPGVELKSTVEGTLTIESPYLGLDGIVLPDRVEFDDQGRFKLVGRVDRIVKVEGVRISLSSIERLLEDHDWVKTVSALTIQRTRIETAIVMQLNDEGRVNLLRSGRKVLIKAFKDRLIEHLPLVVLPRRWRFVERMPLNQQGKLPLHYLESLFDKETVKWPEIIDRQLVDGKLTLLCRIPPRLIYFDGHMADRPVLPGIVQVHWAEYYGRRYLAVAERFKGLEVTKFQQVILPHDEVRICLEFNSLTGKLSFSFESEKGVHSSGRICFAR